MTKLASVIRLGVIIACWLGTAASYGLEAKSLNDLPPLNSFLADSGRAIFHADPSQTNASYVAGPVSTTRQIAKEDILWKKVGPGDGYSLQYSNVYPNGKRVGWYGGGQQLVKVDADTLETLSTYVLHTGKFHSAQEIEQRFAKADKLTGDELFKVLVPSLEQGIERGVQTSYRLLDNNNDLFMIETDRTTGDQYIRKYGDAIAGDPASDIILKGQVKLPKADGERFYALSVNMTYDGQLIVVTLDGTLFAVSRDFKKISKVQLPYRETDDKEFLNAFVRNSMAIDSEGGIYIVARKHMHRVQWTGEKLSLDPKDGAWTIEYPPGERGSGTTPTLMGWHKGQDKLVLISDGEGVLTAYWRGQIPNDWMGLKGQSRRVAATSSMQFSDDPDKQIKLENALVVMGNGVFVANDTPELEVPQKTYLATAIAERYAGHNQQYAIKGGIKWEWNASKRTLDVAWKTPIALIASICSPSINGLLYCGGLREGISTFEALDWETGESVFHYLLGKSYRYVNMGGLYDIAPNGEIECGCAGGYGVIRVKEHD